MAAVCNAESLKVPFTELEISKEFFGLLVIGIDILVVIILFIAVCVLEERVTEYIRAFKKTTIQMNDFTLKISGLPLFTQNEDRLKADLWSHLLKVASLYHQFSSSE